jgi:hypothetical protein
MMKNKLMIILLALILTPALANSEEYSDDRTDCITPYNRPIYACLLNWDKIPIYADEMDEEPIEFIRRRVGSDSILYVTIVDRGKIRLKIEYGVVSACDTVISGDEKTGWIEDICSGQLVVESRSIKLYKQPNENSTFEEYCISEDNNSASEDVRNLTFMLMDVYGDFRYVIFVTHGKIHKGWIKRRYGDILWFWWSDTL